MNESQKNILEGLEKLYPDAGPELHFSNPYETLVATILAAQCTDARVNQVTPAVFRDFPDAKAMAQTTPEVLFPYVKSCGFKSKAVNIVNACKIIAEKYDGQVPSTLEELTALPGVGRKTANLILGDVFHVPGSTVVDTHCIRLMNRMGVVDEEKDPVKIEMQLRKLLPPEDSNDFCHCLVLHGRAVCDARKPRCEDCCVRHLCRHFSGE